MLRILRIQKHHHPHIIAGALLIIALSVALQIRFSRTTNALSVSQGDGIIIYGQSGNTTPQWRTYAGGANTFGNALGTVAGTQPVIVQTRTSPTKQEAIVAYQDDSGNLKVMCYDGNSWYNEWSVNIAPGGNQRERRFDVSYETQSGDAIVVYSKNISATNALAFRTKSGGAGCGSANWSNAIDFPSGSGVTFGTVYWIKMARDARSTSNIAAVAWSDYNSNLGAALWDGSTFTNFKRLELSLEIISSTGDVDSFDLSFESITGDLMVVWGSGGTNGTNGAWYNECVGGTSTCSWNLNRTNISSLLDDATVLDLSSDPTSDRMAFSSIGNANNDLQAAYWNGSSWTGYSNRDTSTEAPQMGMKLTSTGWLTNGANTKWVITYDDAIGAGLSWYTATPGSTPAKQGDFATTPTIDDIRERYEIDNDPFDASKMMFILSDATQSIFAKRLEMDSAGTLAWTDADGTSLGTLNNIPQKGFAFAYWRFIPVANSPPNTPTLIKIPTFPNEETPDTTPVLGNFSATDPDGDAIEYEIQWDEDFNFGSPVTKTSSSFPGDTGWTAATFPSGNPTFYTIQNTIQNPDALTNGQTYWWRVHARDPSGSGTWSSYSEKLSISINTSLTLDRWMQTTGDQFSTDIDIPPSDVEFTAGEVKIKGW